MSAAAAEQPTTTIRIPTSVVDAVREARAARDAGIALAESGDPTGWNRNLIDQAIDAFAAQRRPFSANDLRHLLGDVDLPGALYGARFQHAANNRHVIRYVGLTPSTKKNTHGKPVMVWIGTSTGTEQASA